MAIGPFVAAVPARVGRTILPHGRRTRLEPRRGGSRGASRNLSTCSSRPVGALNFLVYFGTMHRYLARCFNSKLNLVAVYRYDHDANIVTYDDRLVWFPAEYEQRRALRGW